ncbi:hypothetical protein OC834_000431 [Tilletia horrida]|nr:hypothetical protein OC834_000431 [Tilletia horrida]
MADHHAQSTADAAPSDPSRQAFLAAHLPEHTDGNFIQCLIDALLCDLLQPTNAFNHLDGRSIETRALLREGSSFSREQLLDIAPRPPAEHGNVAKLLRQAIAPTLAFAPEKSAKACAALPNMLALETLRDLEISMFQLSQKPRSLSTQVQASAIMLSSDDQALGVDLTCGSNASVACESIHPSSSAVARLVWTAANPAEPARQSGVMHAPSPAEAFHSPPDAVFLSPCPSNSRPLLAQLRPSEEQANHATLASGAQQQFSATTGKSISFQNLPKRVSVKAIETSSSRRLIDIVDSADDISILSVPTSQGSGSTSRSTQGEGDGHEHSIATIFTSGDVHLSGQGLAPLVLMEDGVRFEREPAGGTGARGLINLGKIRKISVQAEAAHPISNSKAEPLDRLWKDALTLHELCVIDIPSVCRESVAQDGQGSWDLLASIQRVNVEPSLEVEVRSQLLKGCGKARIDLLDAAFRSLNGALQPSLATESLLKLMEPDKRRAETAINALNLAPEVDADEGDILLASRHEAKGSIIALKHVEGPARPSPTQAFEPWRRPFSESDEHNRAAKRQRTENVATKTDVADLQQAISTEERGSDMSGTENAQAKVGRVERQSRSDAALLALIRGRRARLSTTVEANSWEHVNVGMDNFMFQRLAAAPSSEKSIPAEPSRSAEPTSGSDQVQTSGPGDSGQVRMLQNSAVLSELQKLKVQIVERDEAGVDLVCDLISGVVFMKAFLLAESLQDTISIDAQRGIYRGFLRQLLSAPQYDSILVICELYTSSGHPLQITPVTQAALDNLHRLLQLREVPASHADSEASPPLGRPHVRVEMAKSAAEAACLCRRFADGLEEAALAPGAAMPGVQWSTNLELMLWKDRRAWLCNVPSDDELEVGAALNPLAAAFVAALRQSNPTLVEQGQIVDFLRRVLGSQRLSFLQVE